MSKVVLMVNDGVYYSGNRNVFDLDELKRLVVEWNKGKNGFSVEVDEDENEVVDVDKLMEMCEDCRVCVYEEDMVEMGDDFVELMVVELVDV